jgi:hypothetical protein
MLRVLSTLHISLVSIIFNIILYQKKSDAAEKYIGREGKTARHCF